MTEFAVANRGPDVLELDGVRVFGECRQQGLVGDQVDASREAAGCFGHRADDGGRKQIRSAITGGAQPETQVLADLVLFEGAQPEAVRDALAQLPDIHSAQIVFQLGLAE